MPLKIGEVARRAGVSIETIRHYESLGVLEEPAGPTPSSMLSTGRD